MIPPFRELCRRAQRSLRPSQPIFLGIPQFRDVGEFSFELADRQRADRKAICKVGNPSFTALSEFTQSLKMGSGSSRKVQVAEATTPSTRCANICRAHHHPHHHQRRLPPRPCRSPKAQGVVAATYVGSKACAGCRAFPLSRRSRRRRWASSSYRASSTARPATARARCTSRPAADAASAGSSRSVKNDTSRSVEDNNAICLELPRQGRPTLLAGQHARDARSRLHELPHGHEERIAQIPAQDRGRARHLLPVPQGQARGDLRARRTCRCAKAR